MTANLPAHQPVPANIIPFPGAMPTTAATHRQTANMYRAAAKALLIEADHQDALADNATPTQPCTAPGCNADLAAMEIWQRRQHMASHSLWRQVWADLLGRRAIGGAR